MIAVLCPVCEGKGWVCENLTTATKECHGCAEWGSKGWLLMPEIADGVLPMPYSGGDDFRFPNADYTWPSHVMVGHG